MDNTNKRKQTEKWFSTSHLKNDIKSQSIKGGFSTVSGQLISFVLSVSSTILLARLLSPDDYGLVAMVTAVTGFVMVFQDFGLSAAIIQKEKVDQSQVSAVFWVNILISLAITLTVSVLAPFLVRFYNEDRLFYITIIYAVTILFAGLSLQHSALMKRQMRFKILSYIQVGSTALSLLIGIIMALIGFGYWALVASNVLIPLFSSIALWIMCDWRPNFSFKLSKSKEFLKFGAGITGFDLINYFSRNADKVLIGKFIGSEPLGLYTKSYQLLMLPITQLRNPLNAVALPALSTLQQEHEKYKSFFKRYLFTLAFFSMPLVITLAIFSDELVLILLGSQWEGAAYIFTLLAISGFIQPVASACGLVLISTGKSKKYFIYGLVNAVFVILSFSIGVQWGIEGVAISYAIINYVLLLPTLFYCFHDSPISVSLFFNEILLPFLFSIASGMAMIIFKLYCHELPNFILLLLGALIGTAIYLGLYYIFPRGKDRLNQIAEISTLILGRFKKEDRK